MTIGGIVVIVTLIAFLLLGLPIAFAMILSATVGLLVSNGFDFSVISIIPQRIYAAIVPFPMLAVPFFIFAGTVMNKNGLSDQLFDFVSHLMSGVRGGIAYSNVLASMIFAGMSGSAVADASGLGMIEIKVMKERGYEPGFAAAVTAASSTIGPIIPPSIPFVLFGTLAGVSVTELFLGGVVPGIFLGLVMMASIYFVAKKRNYEKSKRSPLRTILKVFIKTIPELMVPVIIIWGMLSGQFTPTEAANIAAIYSILIALFLYKNLTLKNFIEVAHETIDYTVKVLLIVGAAGYFGWVLSYQGVPHAIAAYLLGVAKTPLAVMSIVTIILMVFGTFLESIAIMLLTIPIFMPVVSQMGIDPVYFGVFMTMVLAFGLITPPVGLCLYPVASTANVPLLTVCRECIPFYIAFVVVIIALIFFPDVIMFLPMAFR